MIDPSKGRLAKFGINEHRTDLYDNRFDLLGLLSPKEVDYLIIDSHNTDWPNTAVEGNQTTFLFMLTRKVTLQKRVVYNVFMMLGDIGGLNDILGIFVSFIVGIFSSQLMQSELISKLLHQSGQIKTR